jgi:hypothetical protein
MLSTVLGFKTSATRSQVVSVQTSEVISSTTQLPWAPQVEDTAQSWYTETNKPVTMQGISKDGQMK